MIVKLNGILTEIPADMKVVRDTVDYVDYRGYQIAGPIDHAGYLHFEVSPDFGTTILTVSSFDEARDKINCFIAAEHITKLYGELRKAFDQDPRLADSSNEDVANSTVSGYGEHHHVWFKFDMIGDTPVFRL
jgi:hypothetical protein